MHVYIHIYIYAHTHLHIDICIYIYIYMMRMYIYIIFLSVNKIHSYVYIYICKCIYMHVYVSRRIFLLIFSWPSMSSWRDGQLIFGCFHGREFHLGAPKWPTGRYQAKLASRFCAYAFASSFSVAPGGGAMSEDRIGVRVWVWAWFTCICKTYMFRKTCLPLITADCIKLIAP